MTELAKVCRSSVVDLTLQHCTEATQRGFRGKGVGVIQQGISARWRRPITFPDTLLVGSRVHNVKADRFDLGTICWSFECVRRSGQADLAGSARSCASYDFRSV